jgi:hypothetical protein
VVELLHIESECFRDQQTRAHRGAAVPVVRDKMHGHRVTLIRAKQALGACVGRESVEASGEAKIRDCGANHVFGRVGHLMLWWCSLSLY